MDTSYTLRKNCIEYMYLKMRVSKLSAESHTSWVTPFPHLDSG